MKKLIALAMAAVMAAAVFAVPQGKGHEKQEHRNEAKHQQVRKKIAQKKATNQRAQRWDDRWDDDDRRARRQTVNVTRDGTFSGRGRVFVLTGNNLDVRITGDVARLVVRGSNNRVRVDDVDFVEVRGSRNRVFYSDGWHREDPRVINSGSRNVIRDVT